MYCNNYYICIKLNRKQKRKMSAQPTQPQTLTVGQSIQGENCHLVVTAIKEAKQAETQENDAIIKSLKKISGTKWVGNTIHDTLDKCLVAINLNSTNSGWYNPKAKRIPGLTGIYMINQDDSIFCEARIIKESAKQYRIEYLTKTGWDEFERLYSQFIKANQEGKAEN